MKIALITRPENRSPKILALSLQEKLLQIGIESEIIYGLDTIKRLVPIFAKFNVQTRLHFRIRQKLKYYLKDRNVINKLNQFDAIIISEVIPNAFWKNYYNFNKLRSLTKKKIGIYEVFFIDSAVHYFDVFKKNGDYGGDLFDFHLAVSKTSFTKTILSGNKFQIGLNLGSFNLAPSTKADFYALIDFPYPGEEKERAIQIDALRKLRIPYIELKGKYEIEEIRVFYKNAAIFFVQYFESFGLPIAECLSCGTAVFTPNSGWPMAFRLDEEPQLYGPGQLADCFIVYKDNHDLECKLSQFYDNYEKEKTPSKIFNSFIYHYPTFYHGNKQELNRLVEFLRI